MKLCIHRIRELEATVEAQEGDIAAKADAIEAFLATAAGRSSDQASGKTAASGGADQEASSCSHQTTYGEGRAGWMPKLVKLVQAYQAERWTRSITYFQKGHREIWTHRRMPSMRRHAAWHEARWSGTFGTVPGKDRAQFSPIVSRAPCCSVRATL